MSAKRKPLRAVMLWLCRLQKDALLAWRNMTIHSFWWMMNDAMRNVTTFCLTSYEFARDFKNKQQKYTNHLSWSRSSQNTFRNHRWRNKHTISRFGFKINSFFLFVLIFIQLFGPTFFACYEIRTVYVVVCKWCSIGWFQFCLNGGTCLISQFS